MAIEPDQVILTVMRSVVHEVETLKQDESRRYELGKNEPHFGF